MINIIEFDVRQHYMCFFFNQKIYIPGDNDIGGEGRDFRTRKKEERFVKNFENMTGVSTFGFIDYIKVWLYRHLFCLVIII